MIRSIARILRASYEGVYAFLAMLGFLLLVGLGHERAALPTALALGLVVGLVWWTTQRIARRRRRERT